MIGADGEGESIVAAGGEGEGNLAVGLTVTAETCGGACGGGFEEMGGTIKLVGSSREGVGERKKRDF